MKPNDSGPMPVLTVVESSLSVEGLLNSRRGLVRVQACVRQGKTVLDNRLVAEQLAAKNPVAAVEASKVAPNVHKLAIIVVVSKEGPIADSRFLSIRMRDRLAIQPLGRTTIRC